MAFTFFFRDQQTLHSIVDALTPVIIGQSNIQIWDAGCATGEEPYSLAIMLSEKMGHFSFKNVKIYATDINPNFEKIISEAAYPYEKLQRIPKELFYKYFQQTEANSNLYQLVYKIRTKLRFQLNDLRNLTPIEGQNSLILCKNVLLHQKPNERIAILKMFHKRLKNNGILALEQTQKLPDEIKPLFKQIVQNAQIFQKNVDLQE
jgi:chemotaxis protein methyltransferase CheR